MKYNLLAVAVVDMAAADKMVLLKMLVMVVAVEHSIQLPMELLNIILAEAEAVVLYLVQLVLMVKVKV